MGLFDEPHELCDKLPLGLLVLDVQADRVIEANVPMAALLGYERAELAGIAVERLYRAEDLPVMRKLIEATLGGNPPRRTEVPFLRKDGAVLYLDAMANVIMHEGRPCLVSLFYDAAPRRQATALLRMQRDLGIALSSTSNLDTALKLILDAALSIPGTDAGGIYLVTDAGGLRLAVHRGLSPQFAQRAAYRGPESPAAQLVFAGAPDYEPHHFFGGQLPADCIAEGIKALAVVPVVFEGRVIACMNLGSRTPGLMTEDAQNAVESIASDIGAVIVRIQAEQRRRDVEARLRSLLEHLPDFILQLDREGRIVFVNRGVAGLPPEELLGRIGFSFLQPEDRDRAEAVFREVVEKNEPRALEVEDVFSLWWSTRLAPLSEDGVVHGVIVINTDITRQKDDAEALRQEQESLRRHIAMHERDRQLMAYDIHDSIAQQLAAAQYAISSHEEVEMRDPVRALATLDETRILLSNVLDQARRLIGQLRPPIIDELGIVAAIDYLKHEYAERGAATIEFQHRVEFDRLAPPLENALFRIAQEAIRNACRHSQSDRVRVELSQGEGRVRLEVRDWGVGFDPTRTAPGCYGLQRIREYVRLLGGQLTIDTAPQKGACLIAVLPLIERLDDEE